MKYSLYTGIIYRIYNSGTADKIISLIPKDGKKIKALAKGVKKESSKKASSIDLGNLVEVKTVDGYSVPIITEIKLIDSFSQWKKDYKLSFSLQLACEIIDKFVYEDEGSEEIYNAFLEMINQNSLERIEYLIARFTLKVLNSNGDLPSLDYDSMNDIKINSDSAFLIPGEIGFTSNDQSESLKKINPKIYKTERFILATKQDLKVNLSKDEDYEMLKLHLEWIEIALDKRLKGKEIVLDSLRN